MAHSTEHLWVSGSGRSLGAPTPLHLCQGRKWRLGGSGARGRISRAVEHSFTQACGHQGGRRLSPCWSRVPGEGVSLIPGLPLGPLKPQVLHLQTQQTLGTDCVPLRAGHQSPQAGGQDRGGCRGWAEDLSCVGVGPQASGVQEQMPS